MMVGGQALGIRGVIEGIVCVTDLLGNETARKWAAPVVGAVTIGLTAYLILELPSSIPRTVGRRVKASVLTGTDERDVHFVDAHAGRVSRETRKVLRLASWDLRERFRGAMEERSKEVKGAEEMEKRAIRAKEWFGSVGERTGAFRATNLNIAIVMYTLDIVYICLKMGIYFLPYIVRIVRFSAPNYIPLDSAYLDGKILYPS
jgi:mitofusin 2